MRGYQPQRAPRKSPGQSVDEYLTALVDWADKDSTDVVEAAQGDNDALKLTIIHAAPTKTNEGDIIAADGSDYDPGEGEGLYLFKDSAWMKIGPPRVPITLTAEQSLTGATIDFTSIPAGVKRIVVMFRGMSSDGTDVVMIQLGDAGGVEATGYSGTTTSSAPGTVDWSTGIELSVSNAAASVWEGRVELSLQNASTNTWSVSGFMCVPAAPASQYLVGYKALSATLTSIRLNANGSDFDAGTASILYD